MIVYVIAIVLLIFVEFVIFYVSFQFSWLLTAVLAGIQITLVYDLARHVRPSLWSFSANIAASMTYFWVLLILDRSWLMKCLLMFLLSPVFIVANRALKSDIRRDALRRGRRATKIMQRVLNQDQEEQTKFGLYLRPFVSTDHLPAQTSNFRSKRKLR